MVDLRSDTVTKPTPGMRKAMSEAEVGDDVFGEDPTVNALEDKVSAMFGFQAGLFVPSGTMGNQLGLNVLTEAGDEVLIDETGHIFNYESAAAAHLSSVQLHPLRGEGGKLSVVILQNMVRGGHDWEPNTKVVALENSTNKGGGCCYRRKELEAIRSYADNHQLFIHLDGARIWNAMTATDISPGFFGLIADTMSVCFSKGLGAPAGSMILSSRDRIRKARRRRKMWGGGMRQVGVLAAAADYAVDKHLSLLKEDHRRARELARTIDSCDGLSIDPGGVETNILIFDVREGTAKAATQKLQEKEVYLSPFGPGKLRATFHFQVTDEDLKKVKEAVQICFG
ncbi:L-threonine aldolase [Fodinibius roseus]|uniref:L-threonine aldolase n=1 Tax=Fodinibius roseus TaxID=1194090 RepID=A0A1M5FZ32_9BACT|nr:GntG family PLP-dependent aldolase [Fodinibius roseus]SHF96726.1 L-threonine aldolase [Fodinibius roseus]